jgi:hypothetical protein
MTASSAQPTGHTGLCVSSIVRTHTHKPGLIMHQPQASGRTSDETEHKKCLAKTQTPPGSARKIGTRSLTGLIIRSGSSRGRCCRVLHSCFVVVYCSAMVRRGDSALSDDGPTTMLCDEKPMRRRWRLCSGLQLPRRPDRLQVWFRMWTGGGWTLGAAC